MVDSYISNLSVSYNNNINKNIQKNFFYENYNNIEHKQNAREGLNSKIKKIRITDEQNIKKIIKIQAAWRGTYVRIIIGFYWNLCDFKDILKFVMDNYYKRQFLNKLKKNNINKKKWRIMKLLKNIMIYWNNLMNLKKI